jgi:hypothetical protein
MVYFEMQCLLEAVSEKDYTRLWQSAWIARGYLPESYPLTTLGRLSRK